MNALTDIKNVFINRFDIIPLASEYNDATILDVTHVDVRASLIERGELWGTEDVWVVTATYVSDPTGARASYGVACADVTITKYFKAWDMETFTFEVNKFISRLNNYSLPLIAGLYAVGTSDVSQSDLLSMLFCGYCIDRY